MNDKPISDVLQTAIADLPTGTLYELTRGLMLSTCTREALLEYLLAELDQRAKVAREASTASDREGGAA